MQFGETFYTLVTNVFAKNLFRHLKWLLTQGLKASHSFCKQEYSTSICNSEIFKGPDKTFVEKTELCTRDVFAEL